MFNKLTNTIRRWASLLFTKNKKIKDITNTTIDQEHYDAINKWKELYAGYHKPWHEVKYNTIEGSKTRRMKTLNMGKVASEKLAKLIYTEKVDISISDESFGESILNVLKTNRFDKMFQSKLEQMFALGGLILKVNPKQQPDGSTKLVINYITPDCFIPISYENGEITEAAFLNISKKGNKTYCLFEIHEWKYIPSETVEDELERVLVIRNELYEAQEGTSEDAKQIPLGILYPDLPTSLTLHNLTHTLFTYIRPNIANNFDLQSPLGISIFANAEDTLYAIDTAFDSFIREFKFGKRRIIVPAQSIKTIVDPTDGTFHRYFDAADEAYEAFNMQDPDKQKIQDNTVALRISDHVAAINALLNLYASQIGFSAGTFTFDGQGVKTATEIVSEQSGTYQTKQVNEELIEEGLKKFIHTLGEVAHMYEIFDLPDEYDIDLYWDDTIVKDKYTDSDFYIKLMGNGLFSKKRAIMKIMDVTEEEALNIINEISEENMSELADEGEDDEDFLGDVE